jgi:hypothetical protein
VLSHITNDKRQAADKGGLSCTITWISQQLQRDNQMRQTVHDTHKSGTSNAGSKGTDDVMGTDKQGDDKSTEQCAGMGG